jgi:hypothetical protein
MKQHQVSSLTVFIEHIILLASLYVQLAVAADLNIVRGEKKLFQIKMLKKLQK